MWSHVSVRGGTPSLSFPSDLVRGVQRPRLTPPVPRRIAGVLRPSSRAVECTIFAALRKSLPSPSAAPWNPNGARHSNALLSARHRVLSPFHRYFFHSYRSGRHGYRWRRAPSPSPCPPPPGPLGIHTATGECERASAWLGVATGPGPTVVLGGTQVRAPFSSTEAVEEVRWRMEALRADPRRGGGLGSG